MSASTSSLWLHTLAFCCGSSSPRLHGRGRPRRECPSGSVLPSTPSLFTAPEPEKDVAVWSDEPVFTPPPTFAPHTGPEDARNPNNTTQWPSMTQITTTIGASAYDAAESAVENTAKSSASNSRPQSRSRSRSGSLGGRRSLSVRRRFRTHGSSHSIFSSSSRRPQISVPTDFRHLQSESFTFPPVPHHPYHPSQQQPPSFHPLQLNIYYSGDQASSLAPSPDLGSSPAIDSDELPMPSRTHTRSGSTGSSTLAAHDRSYSTLSFHVPRRPLPTDWTAASGSKSVRSGMSFRSGKSAGRTETPPPPTIPPRSRLRSYSSPAVESMVGRIAGAMIEMEKLQADIDSVVERQSLYANSRPSTACRQGDNLVPSIGMFSVSGQPMLSRPSDFGPMPSILAMPSAAPSFAERLSTERPKTAPPRNSTPISPIIEEGRSPQPSIVPAPLYFPPRRTEMATPTKVSPETPPMAQFPTSRSSDVSIVSAASVVSAATAATKAKAAASAWTGSRVNGRPVDVPLAPPLPLVLRPPLWKKKSFSRVSNWLFPGDSGHNNAGHQQMHKRGMSFDSVTNLPRPVTDKDGYYQCVLPPNLGGRTGDRTSMDTALTVDTLSTWTTERGEHERRQTPERQTANVNNDGMEEEDYEYEDEDQTILTGTWSPSSSPVTTKQETATTTPSTVTTMTPVVAAALATEKVSIFGNGALNRPQSVGVAF